MSSVHIQDSYLVFKPGIYLAGGGGIIYLFKVENPVSPAIAKYPADV